MPLDTENPLWRRVAELRGIHLDEKGRKAHVAGDRFRVQVSRVDARKGAELARVARVVNDPSCQGVIGEIVAARGGLRRRDRIPTLRGYVTPGLGWHRGLIEREAGRLAHLRAGPRSE
jgi:hypothetical protein